MGGPHSDPGGPLAEAAASPGLLSGASVARMLGGRMTSYRNVYPTCYSIFLLLVPSVAQLSGYYYGQVTEEEADAQEQEGTCPARPNPDSVSPVPNSILPPLS